MHLTNRESSQKRAGKTVVFVFFLVAALLPVGAWATPPAGNPATYTLDTHFSEGTLVNVNYTDVADQLQLNSQATPFGFIWVAVSSVGTVVKIDTVTGAVLGEYRTAPQGMGLNPSRTTVDNNGNVWVANRNEAGFVAQNAIAPGIPPSSQSMGSAVHIGLEQNGQCIDRNGNGTIDTSTGLGDVKGWSNAGGVDTLGGVSTADDECIVHYTRVTSTGTRHISVDANNDVWISGTGFRNFDLVDGATGAIIRHEAGVGYGGYGGLIDGNGVIWSARRLLRWDTALTPIAGNFTGYSHDSYGLCIDSFGNVWNTALTNNQIRKFAPDGSLIGTYSHGFYYAQGCVVDGNDDVWVAHSLVGGGNSVGHILNNGTYIGNVSVGNGPTGVAVDAAGKIWATNYYTQTASRIDPSAGPTGADGSTPVGAVDFTTVDLGGQLYNYSDMTGSTLIAPPNTGTWTVIHDSELFDSPWSNVSWTSDEPTGSSITVTVASSNNAIGPFSAPEPVTNGVNLSSTPAGQYLKVTVTFNRADGFDPSPVLFDLTIRTSAVATGAADIEPGMVDEFANPGDEFVIEKEVSLGHNVTDGPAEVSMVSDCESETGGAITASFDPPSQLVEPDSPATFTETITVSDDAAGGTYTCTDYVLVDGERAIRYLVEQDGVSTPVGIFVGPQSITDFYAYNSIPASSNTGLEQSDVSIMFLYKGSDGISLVTIHDQPFDASGGAATLTYGGIPAGTAWTVEDDSEDPYAIVGGNSTVSWAWADCCTDGGALNGGLDGVFWITVDAAFNEDAVKPPLDPGRIEAWKFLDQGELALDPGKTVTIHAEPLVETKTIRVLRKDFRHTNRDYAPIDPFTGALLPAELGDPLDAVKVIVHNKKGTISGTAPGQILSTTQFGWEGLSRVWFHDTFEEEFDVNPPKLGGGIDVIVLDENGFATDLTGALKNLGVDVVVGEDHLMIDLAIEAALGRPLAAGETVVVFVKYGPSDEFKGGVPADFPDGVFGNTVEIDLDHDGVAEASVHAEITLNFP